jgi:uncharacterized protein (TIGR00369 family)
MTDRFEGLPTDFKEKLYERMNRNTPFWSLLGMEISDARKGWARIRLPFTGKLANALGTAHGGAIFSTADSAAGIALAGLLREGESISTIEMKINYIRPVDEGDIIAEAEIIQRGRNTAVGDVVVRDSRGNIVARGMGTYIINKRI